MKLNMFQFLYPLYTGKKRYFLFFILVFFCCYVKAQVVNTGNLYIGGNMYVDDNFLNTSTASYQNDGVLNLTGNFNNDQPLMVEGTGTTVFLGTSLQKITGSQASIFHDVTWNNSAGVKMFKNVIMGGTISPINGSLYFSSNALAMGGRINNAYTNTSAFSVNKTSDLIIYGNASAGNKIYFDAAGNTIHDLNITSSGSGVLGNALNVTAGSVFGTVTANGSFDAAGFLTLKSDADGTARVANSAGTISNYVTVERYIPPRRAWRFMTAPIKNDTLTIRTAWQEGANNHDLNYANHLDPHPGFGTVITYDNDWTKGYDVNTTTNPSIRTWNQTNSTWDVAPPTGTTPVTSYSAYYFFIRGSRAVNLALATAAPTDPTIIRETGELYNGTYTKNYTGINTGEYLFVGNPFASSINLATVLSTSSGIQTNKFWVWDPAFNGSYGVGGYVTYANGIMVPITPNYPNPTTIIQGEQGFMLQSNAANASLVFNQNCKVASEADVFGKQAPVTDPHVYINLMLHSADTLLLVDGTAAIFSSRFSPKIDGDDAIKFSNQNENIAMLRFDRRMAIEARPLVMTDTLFIRMSYLTGQPYTLLIKPVEFPKTMHAWLVDKFLNTKTPVNLTDTTLYDFKPTTDTASYMRRFYIVYSTHPVATPVPVSQSESSTQAVEKTLNGSISILPNPVTGNNFQINLKGVAKGNYKAEVFSSDGKVILIKHIEHTGGNNSYKTLLPSGLAAGIYTVSVTNDEGNFTQKTSLVISKN